MDMKFGCINEDSFSLRSPRGIDGDEVDSIEAAMAQAVDMIRHGESEQVAICRCKYYGEDGNGFWGEIPGDGQITIDASDVPWATEEEDEEVVCICGRCDMCK